MAHVYALGGVKGWVRDAADEVGNKFDVSTIYGVGARAGESDHPSGHALDYMVYSDRAKGDSVAAYLKQNWARLDLKYIIWFQRIDEGSGWKPMEDRGGTTANHKDHVHASFLSSAGAGREYAGNGTDVGGGGDTADSKAGMFASLATMTAATTWIRILEFIAGLLILAVTAWTVIT